MADLPGETWVVIWGYHREFHQEGRVEASECVLGRLAVRLMALIEDEDRIQET